MIKMDINSLDRETAISKEEGWFLTDFYVRSFWRAGKFYSLNRRFDVEDIISEIYVKFLDKNFFEKYNPKTTSKKYFVMVAVRNSMIDMLRKLRETASLNAENEEGLTLMETMESDINVEDEAIFNSQREYSEKRRLEILMQLPDETKSVLRGYSLLVGREIAPTYRMLALHLEAGYKVKDIAEMFINPKSGKPVTQGNISSHIKKMREFVLDNVVIA